MMHSIRRTLGVVGLIGTCIFMTACGASTNASDACNQTPKTTVLGMDRILYGETKYDLMADPDAWMQHGRDIDGQTTSAGGSDVCKPIAGGTVQNDGLQGIDNSFGKNIVPLYNEFYLPTKELVMTRAANEMIETGLSTYILALDTRSDSSCGSVTTRFYRSWRAKFRPNFDGTDVWPLDTAPTQT